MIKKISISSALLFALMAIVAVTKIGKDVPYFNFGFPCATSLIGCIVLLYLSKRDVSNKWLAFLAVGFICSALGLYVGAICVGEPSSIANIFGLGLFGLIIGTLCPMMVHAVE